MDIQLIHQHQGGCYKDGHLMATAYNWLLHQRLVLYGCSMSHISSIGFMYGHAFKHSSTNDKTTESKFDFSEHEFPHVIAK